ncbi:prolipoprotein diacylglyceryl transferase [Bartonella clarridgeiae 73]|uniref:Phosphatidylglycerol--prolipoprotein diacylglyceryl transferase n=1 Tax=Bartonella clarridgeiae (strain CCUG 45776 / CIP 104772 / 73) TaxID=696125 RepID=E6YGL9_BARC7|nr:prolipoprotein diacylglyceryl transferase [Bartonella clarridgeiae]WCR55395.1 MAG: Prolipoprotein diacylglyceryl transferase [Bartonella clarridgeiae]CBI76007.1 prolipoprotein diacylglyceryl transferase [Bartonella clarridgeiae 73]
MNDFPFCPAIAFPLFLDPVIIHLGPIAFHWYGLGYVVGILFAWWYAQELLKKKSLWSKNQAPMTPQQISDFVTLGTIGIVVGGRLGQVLVWDPVYYFNHPSDIIALWDGGMSFHGGLIGIITAMLWFSYKNNINVWGMFDTIAAGAPIGIGIVRICNFINQELWGHVTTVPWAVCFYNDPQYLPRHPSQLYEALMEGFLLFIILAIVIFSFKALKRPGTITGIFNISYGIARSISEIFRVPQEDPEWFAVLFYSTGFTYGMALSLPMILFGCYALLQTFKYKFTK